MNRLISRIGAIIVTVTVFFFMVFLITGFTYGSYFVCLFLPIGILAFVHFGKGKKNA